MPNQALPPPHTPGFGRRPPLVAGRDVLVDDLSRVLEAGPKHPRFCRALLGSRGAGKNVSWTLSARSRPRGSVEPPSAWPSWQRLTAAGEGQRKGVGR